MIFRICTGNIILQMSASHIYTHRTDRLQMYLPIYVCNNISIIIAKIKNWTVLFSLPMYVYVHAHEEALLAILHGTTWQGRTWPRAGRRARVRLFANTLAIIYPHNYYKNKTITTFFFMFSMPSCVYSLASEHLFFSGHPVI